MSKTMQIANLPRPLSATQRSHLTGMIALMNVAQGRLEGTQRSTQAQVEAAQKEFDSARDAAQAFLNYCAAELGVSFIGGAWTFDQQQMAFVAAATADKGLLTPESEAEVSHSGQQPAAYSQQPRNGVP